MDQDNSNLKLIGIKRISRPVPLGQKRGLHRDGTAAYAPANCLNNGTAIVKLYRESSNPVHIHIEMIS
jgi:hypothetical protein